MGPVFRTSRLLPTVFAVAAILLVAATSSAADPEALAKARADFRQALVLQTGGDWAGALSLLRGVAEVATTPQVRFNIALCEEHLGRLSAALGDYDIAAASGAAAGAADVASAARARVNGVRGRLPKLRIVRGQGASVGHIALDGNELGEAVLEKEIPVDPGPHEVEIRSARGAARTTSLRLAEGEHRKIEVTLPEEALSAPVLPEKSASQPSPELRPKRSFLLPVVVGSVGLASLAAGGVFALLESSAVKDLNRVCGPSRDACPASSRGEYNDAKTYATATNVTLVVGGVGVIAAAVIFVASKPHPVTAPTTGLHVEIVPSAPFAEAGASVVGRFF
jgi:hypothetical protein